MNKNKNLKFYFKKVSALTKEEKQQMMHLMIATYPAFKKYYLKNKYYSTVKPQMEHLIKDNNILIGVGKLLWRKIKIGETSIKLFAFGVLITKKYQGKGLGTEIIKKDIIEKNNLKEIWDSKKLNDFLCMQLTDLTQNKICKECSVPQYGLQEGDYLDDDKERLLKMYYFFKN